MANFYISYDFSKVFVPGCKPVMFWFLARHGTRNPGKSDIERMRDKLPGIRDEIVAAWREGLGDMTEEDLNYLMDWTFDLEYEDEMLLTR